MTPEQLAHFRGKLTARLCAIFRTVDHHLHEEAVDRAFGWPDPLDEADEAERSFLHDLERSLDERNAALAESIEAALARIARGTYGACIDDGRPIELERLELVPWTERCADDQRRLEQSARERHPTL
jgi:RNA polymerase-binding transcription factor